MINNINNIHSVLYRLLNKTAVKALSLVLIVSVMLCAGHTSSHGTFNLIFGVFPVLLLLCAVAATERPQQRGAGHE